LIAGGFTKSSTMPPKWLLTISPCSPTWKRYDESSPVKVKLLPLAVMAVSQLALVASQALVASMKNVCQTYQHRRVSQHRQGKGLEGLVKLSSWLRDGLTLSPRCGATLHFLYYFPLGHSRGGVAMLVQ
jgi:hypothetical protein